MTDQERAELREIDGQVAEQILGIPVIREATRVPADVADLPGPWWDAPADPFPVPFFTTDAGADYMVLQYIRERWSPERRRLFELAVAGRCATFHLLACYTPGMYSRAALAALESSDLAEVAG